MSAACEKQRADPPADSDTKVFARRLRSTQQTQQGRRVAGTHDEWSWARNGLRKWAIPVAIAKLRRCYATKGWIASTIQTGRLQRHYFFGAVGTLSVAMTGSAFPGVARPGWS